MYMLNGWWFLSSSGSYPPVFPVVMMSNSHMLPVASVDFDPMHSPEKSLWQPK